MLEITNYTSSGIFCDAIIADEHEYCLFASLWARSGDLMSLYGAIVNGTMRSLQVGEQQHFKISKEMEKLQTKMSKHCRYGSDLVHVFIYDEIVHSDIANQRVLIGDKGNPVSDSSIWAAINNLSELYLQQHWQSQLIEALRQNGSITTLDKAYNLTGVKINLSDQHGYETLVTDMIKDEQLTVLG